MLGTLTLKGQAPSVNHLYGHVGNRRYITAAGKALKEDWQWQAKSQWRKPLLNERLFLSVRVYFKDARKRDLDNQLKVIFDTLNGMVITDDSQIEMLLMSKSIDRENPRVEISILSAELAAFPSVGTLLASTSPQ